MNAVTATAEAAAPATKKDKPPLNGVNTPALLATIGVVAGQPQLAKFQFRAHGQEIGHAYAGHHARLLGRGRRSCAQIRHRRAHRSSPRALR